MAGPIKVRIVGEDALTPVLQKVQQELGQVASTAGRYTDAAGRMREANGRFVSAATLAAEAAKRLGTASGTAGTQVGKVAPELDKVKDASKPATAGMEGFGKTLLAVASGMGIQQGLAAVVGSIKNVITSSFQLAASLEQATLAFTTMLGSGEAAREMLDGLRDFANTTPFEFNELQEATKKMLAYGFEAKAVIPTLRAVGDATAALGGGSEMIGRITVALGQMKAKAKISGEELRQLAESGVPALRYLSEGMGVSTAALQKMLEKGLIPAGKGIDLLLAGMSKDFGGMMAKQAETATGKISTLTDSVKLLGTTMGRLILESAKTVVTTSTTFVDAINRKLGAYVNLQEAVAALSKAQKDGLITATQFAKVGGIDPENITLLDLMSQRIGTLGKNQLDYERIIMQNAGYDPVFGKDKLSNAEVYRRALELITEVEAKREAQAVADAAAEKARFDMSHEGFLKRIKDTNDLVESEAYRAERDAANDAAKLARAQDFQTFLGMTKDAQSNFNKSVDENAKDQKKAAEQLAEAEKKLKKLGGGYGAVTGKIAETRAQLLAVIDAQYLGGSASAFQLESLGSLDERHRVHLGTLNSIQAKQAAGITLSEEDVQAKLAAGAALDKLLPALTEQAGWEEAEIERKKELHASSAELESQYGKLMAVTVESGETTDAQKEKLAQLRKEIDDNNASLGNNVADQERAKEAAKMLTDGYGKTEDKLKDLIAQQEGNVGATSKQKEEVEKLREELKKLQDEERNLTKVAQTEALLRIFAKKLELAEATIAEGDREAFSIKERDDLKLWMEGAGLKGNKNAEEQLRARVEAQLTQNANDEFSKLYGENTVANGIAWQLFTKGMSDRTKELVVTSYDEWIKANGATKEQVQKLFDVWSAIQSKKVLIEIEERRVVYNQYLQSRGEDPDAVVVTPAGPAPAQVAPKSLGQSQASATGGPFTGRVPVLVGEAGPELLVPQGMAGNIYSNHMMMGGGGQRASGPPELNITNLTVYGVQNVSSLMAAIEKEARARGKKFGS